MSTMPQPAPNAPDQSQPSGGSQLVGYMGPDEGPFECHNCTFFQGDEGPGQCTNPKVQQDPDVNGQVDSEGCCNEFNSAHNETQEQEHTEGAPGGEEYKPSGMGMSLSAPMKSKAPKQRF